VHLPRGQIHAFNGSDPRVDAIKSITESIRNTASSCWYGFLGTKRQKAVIQRLRRPDILDMEKVMIKLDKTDKKILRLMQCNGRITNLELAEQVNLSATPCSRRVKRLETSGIIDKHVTLLNPEMLGLNLTALIGIEMDRHTPDRFASFEAAIADMPEIIECSIVTGQTADYLLKVLVKDMRHYEHFLLDKLTGLDGVRGVHSSFVLRKVIERTELFVG